MFRFIFLQNVFKHLSDLFLLLRIMFIKINEIECKTNYCTINFVRNENIHNLFVYWEISIKLEEKYEILFASSLCRTKNVFYNNTPNELANFNIQVLKLMNSCSICRECKDCSVYFVVMCYVFYERDMCVERALEEFISYLSAANVNYAN